MAGELNVSPMGIQWPQSSERPFLDSIENGTKPNIDWIREADELILINGQALKWDASRSRLVWESDIQIYSPRAGAAITISAGDLSVSDGEFAYIIPAERPIVNSNAPIVTGSVISRSAIVIGVAIAGIFYQLINSVKGKAVFDNIDISSTSLGTIDPGNSAKVQVSCAGHLRGVAHIVSLKKKGLADDVALEIFNMDPDSGGTLIYELPSTNVPPIDAIWMSTNAYVDRNLWFFELNNDGSMWVRVTNNSSVSDQFTFGIRFREED